MSAEGLQDSADDPGVRLLAAAVRDLDPRELLLVHSGPLPGLRPGATRLILDVRERSSDAICVPATRYSLGATNSGTSGLPAALAEPRFAAAVVWPRAHLGKDFSETCLALGALALRPGGRLYCAVRKNKGGPSLAKAMTALCGDVEVLERDLGYFLYMAEKPARFDVEAARAYLAVEYEIADPLLGPAPLLAVPGVFCRKHLDDGTRALLLELERQDVLGDRWPRQVLDLGAGVGPLGLWAARRWPEARVLAVESNLLAAELIAENAARFGCGPRVTVLASDGLPANGPQRGHLDLALVNPPTHAEPEAFARLIEPLKTWLRPGAPAWFVVNRAERLGQVLGRSGAELVSHDVPGFTVVRASWPQGR
ncbi:MAG: methyltransferase [Nannocystis sp.]|nr:methyltransferase [Nannocystis sp.]MBA3549326.1 methyltransferase [Nannocystis sp.]